MTPQLTVLSYGGGQDSATILHRIDTDRKFRQTYARSAPDHTIRDRQ